MANKIELRGVLDRALGARWCLRGFAPMGSLAKISQSDTVYQRPPDERHVKELVKFYSKDLDNLFFPELTLGLSLDVIGATDEEDGWLYNGPLNEKSENYTKYWQHKVGSIFAKFYTLQGEAFRTASLSFTDDAKCLYRIDGNHRLLAAEELLNEYEAKKNQGMGIDPDAVFRQVPFCLIIFKKGEPWRRVSATYFTNINFKALPLSAELNVRGIVRNTVAYPDDKLFADPSFGPSFVFCRRMCDLEKDVQCVESFIGREGYYPFFQELGKELIEGEGNISDVADLHKLCENVSAELGNWIKEDTSTSRNCFMYRNVVKAAAFYYHWLDLKTLGEAARKGNKGRNVVKGACSRCIRFLSWIRRARIGQSIDMPLQELLGIFDSVYGKLPKKLFLARWYPEASDEKRKADARYAALKKIAEENNLELVDMEHQRRGAFSIRDAIDSEIPESDLFVADLTGVRPNVMVEIGMALHHLPMNRVLFFMQKADKVPGMEGAVENPPFDLSGYSYDKIVDSSEIEERVGGRVRGILNEMCGGSVTEGVDTLLADRKCMPTVVRDGNHD